MQQEQNPASASLPAFEVKIKTAEGIRLERILQCGRGDGYPGAPGTDPGCEHRREAGGPVSADPVLADCARHQSALDAAAAMGNAVEERAQAIYETELTPLTGAHLAEALGEIEHGALAVIYAQNDDLALGSVLRGMVEGYLWDYAMARAEREIEREQRDACPRCRGAGCRSCAED